MGSPACSGPRATVPTSARMASSRCARCGRRTRERDSRSATSRRFGSATPGSSVTAEIEVETTFVEHAYIEPEAGVARRVGDRLELTVSTQAPYMDRDEVALILGIPPTQVRIIPTACGGGFGGKLDLGVHPLLAIAAWRPDRPGRAAWTRPASMAASPKRPPARIRATAGAAATARLARCRVHRPCDTPASA